MMEELERSHIDRNSPIWGGSDCDYFSLEAEVNSYWTQYYKIKLNLADELLYQTPTEKEEIEEHNRLIQALEDGVFDNTELKTEEYFRELWRDVSKVGFDLENSNHCIDTCKTLIREEVEWWEQREDLKEYRALKVPSLVEYHSWDVIWKLCKYHKLVAHPLHNFASKVRSDVKKNLFENKPVESIKLNLNNHQFEALYQGLIQLNAFSSEHKDEQFYRALNGSEYTAEVEPIKFTKNNVLCVFIMFCREYRFLENMEYYKWSKYFDISSEYARKLVSDLTQLKNKGVSASTHRTLPPLYDEMESLFESIQKKA